MICSPLSAAEADNTAERSPVTNDPCDFSTSRRVPNPQLTELMKQLPVVEKSGDKKAAKQWVDKVWESLYSSCANYNDANAIIWRLTQTLDRTAQYDEALVLLKKASEATSGVEQRYRFIHKATTQAMLAGKETQARQLIKDYLSAKHLPAALWQLDKTDNRLHYPLAQLAVPLTSGHWTLEHIYSTGQRDGTSIIRFANNGDGIYNVAANYVSAEMMLHYRETEDIEHSVNTTQTKRPWLYATTNDAELAVKLPDIPGDKLKQIKSVQRYSTADDSVATATWQITQGPWEMTVLASFPTAHSENAIQQLATLFMQIQWPRAETLPPIQKELDALTKKSYQTATEWNKAARQAASLLPAAKFPHEIAGVNTILGIQAYRQNKLEKAWSYLQLARTAYAQTLKIHAEENYGPQALLMYLTDIAYQMKKSTYTELVKESFRHSPMGDHWFFAPSSQSIVNKKSQLHYPFNAGIFHASAITYIEGTVVYSAAQYGYSLEFFAGKTVMPDMNQPEIVKGQVRRLQKKDRQKIAITDKDLHKSTYSFTVQGQKKTATKWSVKWYSDNEKTEKTLIYWAFPYQDGHGGIIATVDNKDKAILPKLDEFAKTLVHYSVPTL